MTHHQKDKTHEEFEFLDHVTKTYSFSSQNRVIRELVFKTFAPYIKGGKALELGCSDGYMTGMLSKATKELDVMDGSKIFLERVKAQYPAVQCIHSLFEDYQAQAEATKYDSVFACYVLEHVADVSAMLRMVKSVLKPGGLFFVVVPNARALSRQLALHMGIISDLKALTENDLNHGHRRVYDRVAINRELENNGFEIISQGGVMLKFLADFQMDRLIDEQILAKEHIEGLYKLGLEYPDLCSSLFSVCRVKGIEI